MERLASEIVGFYGDGICRARATKYMTKYKVYPPRGLCVITVRIKLMETLPIQNSFGKLVQVLQSIIGIWCTCSRNGLYG